MDGHELQVVGVMDRPAASLPGQDDTRVLIPYFTMHKMFPNVQEHMLMVIAYPGMIEQAQDEVRAVLRHRAARAVQRAGHISPSPRPSR